MSEPDLVDLQACEAEPIRIPGGVQPHGALMVLDPVSLQVLQVSANLLSVLGVDLAPGDSAQALPALAGYRAELGSLQPGEAAVTRATQAGRALQVSAHRTTQGLIVEFEPAAADQRGLTLEALYPRLRRFLDRMAAATSVEEIADAAVLEVRALTGFDRVLLYSFDAQGVGTVLAEDGDGVLPSYQNLKFPAFDIPAQARELYKLSRIRLIPNADYTPAPILPPLSPVDGQPLDLGQAALRSVSPVHLEYMRNMGTLSSMSISIVVEDRLWGLVSGHSRDPREVDAQVRSACDHLGQVLSLQIEAREQARRVSESLHLRQLQTSLLARVAAAPDYARGLSNNPDLWLAVGGGAGAALVNGEEVIVAGLAPEPQAIRWLAERLFESGEPELALDSLAARWPDAAAFADAASGLLAVSISQIHPNYLMWFRPEAVRTVEWAGEPQKPRETGARLHPRKSFELWKEQVRLRALPWTWEEVDSARAFRAAIQEFVLRRAEERAELTHRLTEINKELESFSYSISHDLRAPFRHVVGYADLLAEHISASNDATASHYIASIRESALFAGRLVDDLLSFSQMGRHAVQRSRVDMNRLVGEVRRSLAPELRGRRVEWRVGKLPPAWGDPPMVRQLLNNLLQNAVKYSAPRQVSVITVSGEETETATRYRIADNGVGFDMAYVHKLFTVFQRLHRADEFEGTGIGLALVRRIVERHGGEVSAQSTVGEGAAFTFTLPKRAAARPSGDDLLG